MKEFKTLLESELLSDEVKKDLSEAVENLKQQLTEEVTKTQEITYAKKLYREKKEMNAKVMETVKELVAAEVTELKEDIAKYRNLDITYAKKLEEFKIQYTDKLRKGAKKLIETRVAAELTELRQDLLETQKLNFGKKIFEAYASEFETFGTTPEVKELQKTNENLAQELVESKKVIDKMNREKVLEGLLSNLSGGKREIMKNILENVKTDKLATRYNEAIQSVLTEDKKVVNKKETVKETVNSTINDEEAARLRKLMGK